MGTNVASILFRNARMNGEAVRNGGQLKRDGHEVAVPEKFER